jgi:hypothetical protein
MRSPAENSAELEASSSLEFLAVFVTSALAELDHPTATVVH